VIVASLIGESSPIESTRTTLHGQVLGEVPQPEEANKTIGALAIRVCIAIRRSFSLSTKRTLLPAKYRAERSAPGAIRRPTLSGVRLADSQAPHIAVAVLARRPAAATMEPRIDANTRPPRSRQQRSRWLRSLAATKGQPRRGCARDRRDLGAGMRNARRAGGSSHRGRSKSCASDGRATGCASDGRATGRASDGRNADSNTEPCRGKRDVLSRVWSVPQRDVARSSSRIAGRQRSERGGAASTDPRGTHRRARRDARDRRAHAARIVDASVDRLPANDRRRDAVVTG
jgi:hypothetical protein